MSELINTSPTSNIILCAEANKAHSDYLLRLGTGALLEDFVKDHLESLNFTVEKHATQHHGLDVTAHLGNLFNINAECLNWWGGYIHPKRWKSITRKLSRNHNVNILFSFGVEPTSEQYAEAKASNIHVIHYPKQLDVFDEDKISMINWLKRQVLKVLTDSGVITNRYSIDNSSNVSSYIDSRTVLNSKFNGFASWFKAFIGRIKGEKAESIENSLDSLQVNNEGMDKKQVGTKSVELATDIADLLADNIKNKDKCKVCGKSGNRSRWVSVAYCDRCLTKMIIDALDEEGLMNFYPLQYRELKKQDDYIR